MNELKKYIKDGFVTSERYMSVVHNGIRYIYEAQSVDITVMNSENAEMIGIYVIGKFFYIQDKYQGLGESYMEELAKFEQTYNTEFDKQMKRYSVLNPIGGKLSISTELRLKDFEKNDLQRVATDLIFGNYEMIDKPIDHSYFEPFFLRYLLLGYKSLDNAVKADINEHADELNFTLISENMVYKRIAELLRNEDTVNRIALYGKIKRSDRCSFKTDIKFENIIFSIDIDKTQLLPMVKQDKTYTYKNKLVISFDDIVRISENEQTIYEKCE